LLHFLDGFKPKRAAIIGLVSKAFRSLSYMTVNFARIVNFPSILSVDVLHIPWICREFHWQRSQGRTKID
jgi:hypothetical protein